MSRRFEAKVAYFQLATNFFQEYRWIYDFKATNILSENVMQAVPLNFQEYFKFLGEGNEKFRNILALEDNVDWPPGVSKFINDCVHLKNLSETFKAKSVANEARAPVVSIASNLNNYSDSRPPKKWTQKKYLEVVHVGNFVGDKCKLENCDVVIDIGSGLGYLSQHIANHFGVPVVGIEGDLSRVNKATAEYLSKKDNASLASQTYICHRITANMSEEILPYVDKFSSTCVTALHACGDLTPWSLKHFVSTDSCKMIAVVPCCYHKMNIETPNCPMSLSLKSILSTFNDSKFLENQWLWRLACQRSGHKFLNDINKETEHLFFRAILETVCTKELLRLQRRKRNLRGCDNKTFQEYVNDKFGENGEFNLFREERRVVDSELASVSQLMMAQHDKLISWKPVITGILALQGAMQDIAEDILLIDRLVYMEESENVKECKLIKVIPDDISPRGMVLVGIRK